MITIPESVLADIQRERPSLSPKIDDLRRNPSLARYLERDIASGYLASSPRSDSGVVAAMEACQRGERFGGGVR